MNKIICFGEALIDFVPTVSGLPLSEVEQFRRAAGGAPANVAVAIAKLGGESYFAGKVGEDAFGQHLESIFQAHGVKTDYLLFTNQAKTALAFVSLRADGERDFLFFREPSADMLISAEEIEPDWFQDTGIFHYGSITLTWPVSKSATLKCIELAQKAGVLLSFDPNLRFSLWPSPTVARNEIVPLLPTANVLKVSEEELAFLANTENEQQAAHHLLGLGISLLLVTKGQGGCSYYTPDLSGKVPVAPIKAMDTTGAGDAFVGGFLYQLANHKISRQNLDSLIDDRNELESVLRFANGCGAITTTNRGAIPALPDRNLVERFLKQERGN
jgi:fructokinase